MDKTKINEEIEHLMTLLKLEREADYLQYKKFIENLPLTERIKKGYTWYPLEVKKSGYTFGARAFVEVVRTSNLDEPHQFRSGKIINLFTQQPSVRKPERSGVIHFVDKNRMKIILNTKDLPDWLGLGLIGVDLMFDERSYVEMEKALKKLLEVKNGRLHELKQVVFGNLAPVFQPVNWKPDNDDLNESQINAVKQVLAARDVAIIHGPPGTGKTTTLVEATIALKQSEPTILVTAPSNTAVDLITERLVKKGLIVVRIGNISRVDESIMNHTLEVRLSKHPEAKNIKKIKTQAAEYRRMAKKYKRRFGAREHQQRQQLFKEAGELMAWAKNLEDRILDQILEGADVITSTLVGAANEVIQHKKFRTVIIDEAAQALEPASWIPIIKASKVILAGDPHQLPPTVKSEEAKRGGFDLTLIEKGLNRHLPKSLLEVQYRMNGLIMGFSNEQFYNNHLVADQSVVDHKLQIDENHPFVFIDTAGCGFQEQLEEKYQSRFNPEELNILEEHLIFSKQLHLESEFPIPSIAIISPYREQVIRMKHRLEKDERFTELSMTVNTIDGFQGQESDVVYISLVRSNEKGEIGFLKDIRRMNVAMTRARKQLIVIGDSATIGSHPFYSAFLDYTEKYGKYQTAWEYMQ